MQNRKQTNDSLREFDWHCDTITTETPINSQYKNTQNVRRFLQEKCGADFKFNREFMVWIKDGQSKTMGDIATEWIRRNNQ